MNEKTLYLECYSGISGDMTVAALLDLGADQKVLLDGLKSLNVSGYQLIIGRRNKSSIDACDFDVIIEQDHHPTADHPIHTSGEAIPAAVEHYHTSEEHHHTSVDHTHTSDEHHHISEEHTYASDEHHHASDEHTHASDEHFHAADSHIDSNDTHIHMGHHEHRNLLEINTIIEQSEITPHAKELAKKIFYIIACAEAKAHAKALEEVHFHEVGAVDSIVDIVATAICLDNLNIKNVIVSELYEGTGQIQCQHGLLPIPVPAVANIVSEHRLSLHITNVRGELVTPTGAAIVAAIKTGDTLPKEMKITKIGLGAGKRNYDGATGILRAMLLEEPSAVNKSLNSDKVWVLEANIDDCTGEALSLAMELLFENGAKDVYYSPIYMKKNRPAYLLGVICKDEDISRLESIIFTHTTTIGIRKQEAYRTTLPRIQKTINTPYGAAVVKVCTCQDKTFVYPEYESVKLLCQKTGLDYMTMYHNIRNFYQD